MHTLRTDSLEYLTATLETDHDVTGMLVEVAIPVMGEDPVTWYAAEVTLVTQASNGRWLATYRLLVGPGGDVQLAAGVYDWIVRLTDSPEVPVRNAGNLKVV